MAVNGLLSVVLSGGGRRETGKPTCSTACETLGPHDLIRVIVGALATKPYFSNMLEHLLRDGEQPYPPPKPLFIKFLEHFQGGELGSKSEPPTFPGYSIHTMIPIKSWRPCLFVHWLT